jgi:lipoprotein-releasing system permease protein
MYKLLLSWRYLRTRYLALASIISVMLGVATLIVVNSVMGGFATKLKTRLRGQQADVIVESRSTSGMHDYPARMARIRDLLGDKVAAISPVIEGWAMLQFRFQRHGATLTKTVRLIGVDPGTKSQTGEFARYLRLNQANPAQCFTVQGAVAEAHARHYPRYDPWEPPPQVIAPDPNAPPPPEPPPPSEEELRLFGAVVGYGIATYRNPEAKATDPEKDIPLLEPGDEITLTTVSSTELEGQDGARGYPRPVFAPFVVTDVAKCDMSEIDSNTVYVHIQDMQRLRTMQNRATALQLKLRDYDRDAEEVVRVLAQDKAFHPSLFVVQTWEHKQGPLLAAIGIERGILNVLLFLIIAVAGFGILAIFFMVVVEKMRDIGVLKALGASNAGVMGIFLSYGLGLGLVGALMGTVLGVTITVKINEVEQWLSRLTGHDVFPRDVYYFDKIPTDLQAWHVAGVIFGSLVIAVGASVLPSLRAALMHPVRALRYD